MKADQANQVDQDQTICDTTLFLRMTTVQFEVDHIFLKQVKTSYNCFNTKECYNIEGI